jgi:primosomal replication protein N
LRYTPAGMPIVNAVLQHRSQQMEAGIARLTEFEVPQLLQAKFQAGSAGGWEGCISSPVF